MKLPKNFAAKYREHTTEESRIEPLIGAVAKLAGGP
jgi:hypothetical protein